MTKQIDIQIKIKNILESKGGCLPLSEIYDEFWKRYVVSDPRKEWYAEYTRWNEPRYRHHVRRALESLQKRGIANNPQRGIWALKP